jgi:AbiU2
VPPDVHAEVAKWRSWIDEPIRNDVVDMHFKRLIWREVNQMVAANPEVGDVPSAFWDFHHDNYAVAQAIAVRRQADTDPRTCALALLIKEMRGNAELLTREYFVGLWDQTDEVAVQHAHAAFDRLAGDVGDHLDPAIPRRDFEALRNDARRVRAYVNQHVAHDQAEPTAELPTLAELHAAIDSVGEIFKRYAVVLTAGEYVTVEPFIQDDWQAIFRVPWLRS